MVLYSVILVLHSDHCLFSDALVTVEVVYEAETEEVGFPSLELHQVEVTLTLVLQLVHVEQIVTEVGGHRVSLNEGLHFVGLKFGYACSELERPVRRLELVLLSNTGLVLGYFESILGYSVCSIDPCLILVLIILTLGDCLIF